MTIYNAENEIWSELEKLYPEEQRQSLVQDGLCWRDISKDFSSEKDPLAPENIWKNSKRRILFLTKEPNRNAGEDYRGWEWYSRKEESIYCEFADVISLWLKGLLETTIEHEMSFIDVKHVREIFKKFPLAIINIKKFPGVGAAKNEELINCAKKTGYVLRKHINLLCPNIVVCCGSSDNTNNPSTVRNLALNYIFHDINDNFQQINNWCYYSNKNDLLLIDSWHPSARIDNGYTRNIKVEELLANFQHFLLKVAPHW